MDNSVVNNTTVNNELEYTKELLKELIQIVSKDEQEFQNSAYNFDDSNENKYLLEYNRIVSLYFDKENSDTFLNFKEAKNNILKLFKSEEENLEAEELLKKYEILEINPNVNVRVLKKEFEFLSTLELIYLEKYNKLIKKTINNSVKTRIVGNAGDILSSEEVRQKDIKGPSRQEKLKQEAHSYAIEGFLLGMRRYQPSSGNKLITYTTYWLNQRVIYYIEKSSSLNKPKKTFDGLSSYEFESSNEEEEFLYKKYAHIKYTNYNFVNIGDMATNLNADIGDASYTLDQEKKLLKILRFFCENKDLLLYYEYLLLKYDILFETYLYFTFEKPNEAVKKCFFKDVEHMVTILSQNDHPELVGFNVHKDFNKIEEILYAFFDLEHSDYLSVRRTLKQKFLNILTKVFALDFKNFD